MDTVNAKREPIFFGGETAVEYWRRASRRGVRPAFVPGIPLKSMPDFDHLAESSYNLRALANLRGPLHVFVSDIACVPKGRFDIPFSVSLPDPRQAPALGGEVSLNGKHRSTCASLTAEVVAHKLSAFSGLGPYCYVAPDVYIASPTLALIQCSGRLSLPSLMQLAYELCGMFSVDALASKGYVERLPLADSSSVSSAIEQAVRLGTVRGTGALKTVADRLIDGIRCPSAAALCSLFCAPAGCGGYALPMPSAGVPYRLSNDALTDVMPCGILIDLLWTKKTDRLDMDWSCCQSVGVIVCDGGMRSSRRVIELYESMPCGKNIALVCLTASDLKSRSTCSSVAKMIREVVGCRKPRPVDNFVARNESMRADLFESVSMAS